jgi:hypothetical protein
MTAHHCLRSNEVHDAVRSNRWSAELGQHLDTCDICFDIVWSRGIEHLAGELHQQAMRRASLDATTVWWQGRVAARAESLAIGERPFAVMQVACLGLGTLVTAAISASLLLSTPVVADAQHESVAVPFVLLTTVMTISSILSLRIAK